MGEVMDRPGPIRTVTALKEEKEKKKRRMKRKE